MVCPGKIELYLKMNAWRDQQLEDLISECGQGLAYWVHKYYLIMDTLYLLFSKLKCEICTRIKVLNLKNSTVASYNVSSIVFYVLSMLIGLGCIVISDLVVVDLFMHSLSGMILLYLAMLFLYWRHFCMSMYIHIPHTRQ